MTGIDPFQRGEKLSLALNHASIGEDIYAFAAEIYPLFRSVSGAGSRETFARMAKHVDLTVHEVASGTQVFDWTVPNEWRINDAYIADASGKRVLDLGASNLHVINYSAPAAGRALLSELKPRIHTLPDKPSAIPYVTSFFQETWGFCMAQAALDALPEGEYEYKIDSSLAPGSMSYAEFAHKGEEEDEILIFSHSCHPSLANDNCSGLAVSTFLAKQLSKAPTRYSYRFVWAPTTIGSIAWLARNENAVSRIRGGLVLSNVGDGAPFTYKKSRRGAGPMDRAMAHLLVASDGKIIEFTPQGYDERQFNSPGFLLEVGTLMRGYGASYPSYHTSDDNLDRIRPEYLGESYRLAAQAISIIERDGRWQSVITKCEPQLGRRGLHASYSFDRDAPAKNAATMWTAAFCDGANTLLDIAVRAAMPFERIYEAAAKLAAAGLITPLA
ncbi:MAG: DUF4910 domain-containing protein [Hydrogenophilaceae bacterium]|jgi:aminopeptidase-like protein|nr:DUF4910 domain-containing protein [Hydrogenophilaceae bacterium]